CRSERLTTNGVSYAVHSPSSSRYSTRPTPEPPSWAVSVTVTQLLPVYRAVVCGGTSGSSSARHASLAAHVTSTSYRRTRPSRLVKPSRRTAVARTASNWCAVVPP